MIGSKDNDRFLLGVLKHLQYLADLVIEIRDIGKIGASRPGDMIIGDVKTAPVIGVEYPLGMRPKSGRST